MIMVLLRFRFLVESLKGRSGKILSFQKSLTAEL